MFAFRNFFYYWQTTVQVYEQGRQVYFWRKNKNLGGTKPIKLDTKYYSSDKTSVAP